MDKPGRALGMKVLLHAAVLYSGRRESYVCDGFFFSFNQKKEKNKNRKRSLSMVAMGGAMLSWGSSIAPLIFDESLKMA